MTLISNKVFSVCKSIKMYFSTIAVFVSKVKYRNFKHFYLNGVFRIEFN